MANQLVTDLDAIITLPDSGIIHVIDTTVTTQNAAGSSFKITKANLLKENTADILLNTAKVGITTTQATAITNNTSKIGYTDALVAAAPSVAANTAKVGITTGQASAITDNTANRSKVSINTDAASFTNLRSLRYREETYSSNLDMVMQTEVGVYNWVNIKTNAFNVVNSLVTRFKNRVATDSGTFENQTALETFLGTITSTLTTVLAAITPNAFKAGKLYSVIPNTAAVDATVVRNTTATRINSSGVLVTEPANVARISYTLNTGGEGFILDEPQRTNVITQSNGFNTTSWEKLGSTAVIPIVTANSITSPDGTINAALVEISSIADIEFSTIKRVYTALPANAAGSIFLRAFDSSQVGKKVSIFFNGSAGITGITVTLSLSFQRFQLTTSAVSDQFQIGKGRSNFSSGGLTQAEMATKFYIYEAQVEQGSTATSTIKTTTSAVTRNADIITVAPPVGTLKITTTFSNNSTQVLTTIPATFTLPEGLIKSVNFNNTL